MPDGRLERTRRAYEEAVTRVEPPALESPAGIYRSDAPEVTPSTPGDGRTTDTGFTVNVIEGEPDYFWGV